jgi:hypothetical protein
MVSKGCAGPAPSLSWLTHEVPNIVERRQALETTLPVLSLRWVDGCHWQTNLTNVCLLSLCTPKWLFRLRAKAAAFVDFRPRPGLYSQEQAGIDHSVIPDI